MLRGQGLLYIGAMVLLSCLFQYQSKILADDIAPILARAATIGDKMQGLMQGALIVRLVIVLGLAGLLFVVWLLALTKLDLSVALPLAAIALVVNAIGTGVLLGEEIGALRIGGVLTVAAGIVMVLKS
jgi:multidrug transporter EmrE-like cation transporter